MRRASFTLTPATYRRITLVAAILIAIIIVTGAAVRLTNSGLGCSSWPNCEAGQLVARPESSMHQKIESANRLFTGLVSLGVIAAVLGAFLRRPRRHDLLWLSAGLVAGVMGQIVLGGITVLVDLHPAAVMSHFLLSMVLLADAIVLYHRAGIPDGTVERRAVTDSVLNLGRLLLALVTIVVVTGTVVTNTGPHAGDKEAKRFGFFLPDVARVHGIAVVVFLVGVLALLVVAHRTEALHRLQRAITVLLVLLVAQAGVGYTQYFTGVPPLLVGIHIAGAAAVFTATVALYLRMYDPQPASRTQHSGVGAHSDRIRPDPTELDEPGRARGRAGGVPA
ncbi:MAG: COX15/CtaA family protein [Acidimicrobiia bacterium]